MPDGPGGFAQNYSCSALLRMTPGSLRVRVRDSHPLRCGVPAASTPRQDATSCSYYPRSASPHHGFGLFPVRSPLLGESLLFSLPQGTKMFQFPWFASLHTVGIAALQAAGLSHSEIAGSTVTCTYPALIAAYHVLHRLREPRHPPDALNHFRLHDCSYFLLYSRFIIYSV